MSFNEQHAVVNAFAQKYFFVLKMKILTKTLFSECSLKILNKMIDFREMTRKFLMGESKTPSLRDYTNVNVKSTNMICTSGRLQDKKDHFCLHQTSSIVTHLFWTTWGKFTEDVPAGITFHCMLRKLA